MLIGLLLLLGLAGFAAYGALYWVGGQTQWEGVFGGIGLFAFGFGLSAWGKYLLPQGPFVEERHALASTEVEVGAMAAAIEDRGKMVFRRRGFLGDDPRRGRRRHGRRARLPPHPLAGAPRPRRASTTTNWSQGRPYLVDINGRPHPPGRPRGGRGRSPCSPRASHGTSVDQTMLDPPGPHRHRHRHRCPGRETWGPEGYLALLQGVHARRLPGRALPGGDRSSCCARATSRCSTSGPAATRCSAPRPARCRSCRS